MIPVHKLKPQRNVDAKKSVYNVVLHRCKPISIIISFFYYIQYSRSLYPVQRFRMSFNTLICCCIEAFKRIAFEAD